MAILLGALSCTVGYPAELTIAAGGKTEAVVVVSPDAKADGKGPARFEHLAAADLAKYIGMMSGATPTVAATPEAIAAALQGPGPVLLVGSEALKAEPALLKELQRVAKPNPILRADAIVVRRQGNRVYLAGLTDAGHYHAVAWLLQQWGCRWYLPTNFGECIPERPTLTLGEVNHVYASPFELRNFWNAWNGSNAGQLEFQLRNYMTVGVSAPGCGHALDNYTKELAPPGKSIFNIPVADQKTMDHVAAKVDEAFKNNQEFSLAIADGVYVSDSPIDAKLQAGQWDKYFMTPGMSDVFMTFYNGVCERLLAKYPESKARIGFLAYSNMTIPPQQVQRAAKPLVAALAPIDIDPNHGMDDPRSPPRQEYREMLYGWARVMEGRVWIYDYDQGMLVWRDLPNPSHQAFRQDVQHYRKAGILGLSTESRNAVATIFLNLYFRGQLMWNPDYDLDAGLKEFYPLFYGPAAEPAGRYWTAIFRAWEQTAVTEHEFFVIPAIYTPELVSELRRELAAAEAAVAPLAQKAEKSPREQQYLARVQFTRASFDVIDCYTRMVFAGARDCDYAAAHQAGKDALARRLALAKLNPTFTTRVVGPAKDPEYGGSPAWFPGEAKLYGDLEKLTNGTDGTLVAKLPLEWAFRRDPYDAGTAGGWARRSADLTFWQQHPAAQAFAARPDYPVKEWELLRTDLYMQAQGVLHPDGQSYTGHAWYQCTVKLSAEDAAKPVHIRLPGIFGDSWLWANGELVGNRPQRPMWWVNDYAFQWDVDLTGKVTAGENVFTVRVWCRHHLGGMFRRPFLYVPKPAPPAPAAAPAAKP